MTLSEFFHMGGYGFYVWSAYLLGLAVLAANVLWAWQGTRRRLRELGRGQDRRGARR